MVAIVVGIMLLKIVDDSGAVNVGAGEVELTTPTMLAPTTGTTVSTPATQQGTTPTTKPKRRSTSTTKASTSGARPPNQVVVQVLNGSGVQGAASQKSNDLVAKGYQVVTPANATSRTGTVVECKSGFDKEAAALVSTLKDELGTNATVEALPNPLPTDYDDTANCYVVLGR